MNQKTKKNKIPEELLKPFYRIMVIEMHEELIASGKIGDIENEKQKI